MKEHEYKIEGIKPQIMTEIATLLHTLYTDCGYTKEDFARVVALACMTMEEIREEVKEVHCDTSYNILDRVIEDAVSGKQEAIDALKILTNITLRDTGDENEVEE